MNITLEKSPYGDEGTTYSGALGMFQHYILQLKSFRVQDKTKEEREHLESDIRGYEEVLASGSEKNAENFLKIKQEARAIGVRFKNNEDVIKYMKDKNLWEVTRDSSGSV